MKIATKEKRKITATRRKKGPKNKDLEEFEKR